MDIPPVCVPLLLRLLESPYRLGGLVTLKQSQEQVEACTFVGKEKRCQSS